MKKILLSFLILITAISVYAEDNTFLMKNLLNDVYVLEAMSILERKEALRNYAKQEAFILFSIRQRIGRQEFDKRLKNIPEYGYWGTILEALDDNKSFYNGYYKKKRIILQISDIEYTLYKASPAIVFSLKRENGETEMNIGYTLKYKDKSIEGTILSIRGEKQDFIIPVEIGEVELLLDSKYTLFREYSNRESAFDIPDFTDSKNITLIYDNEKRREKLEQVFAFNKIIKTENVKFEDIKNSNIVIDGYENRFSLFFADNIKNEKKSDKRFSYIVNPLGYKNNILILNSNSFNGYDDLIKYNTLNEEVGIQVLKRERDIATPFKQQTIETVLKNYTSSKVFFIGETHTNYAHHLNQLEIIDYLYKNGNKVAIALEMFPTDMAPILNAYTSGKISEEEMIKKTNYFKVWGYDYNLYAPIFQYARMHKLDLVPLNISKEKIYKVASGEIDSLEKNDLPLRMNLTNREYANKLAKIYYMHPPKSRDKKRRLEEFVLSQNIWDEFMAASLLNYTKSHKNTIVVVIAGSGHLNKNSGIPLRYKRLGGEESTVIAMDSSYNETNADIFIETEEIIAPISPKLGIISSIEANSANGILIESVEKNSIAEKAGLKAKDILLNCGKYQLKDISSLKYMLYAEGYGAQLDCKVKRNNKIINNKIILNTKLEKK